MSENRRLIAAVRRMRQRGAPRRTNDGETDRHCRTVASPPDRLLANGVIEGIQNRTSANDAVSADRPVRSLCEVRPEFGLPP